MRDSYKNIGLGKLCGWFGLTRQAYYQSIKRTVDDSIEMELVVQMINRIRKSHPRMGGRKLYELLHPFLQEHQIKLGRDGLFDILAENNLLVKRKKRRVRTTNSYHHFRRFPNLIRDYIPTAPNQLWVSDITYWRIDDNTFLYISFITDAFSRKIVGYHVAETLETIESLRALRMALSTLGAESHTRLIHHSDRGVQYCSGSYVKLLQKHGVQISMTENGDPRENAIAERINGIIKEEYLCAYRVINLKKAKSLLKKIIALYNDERPHMSITYLTPSDVHDATESLEIRRLWKNNWQKETTFVNA